MRGFIPLPHLTLKALRVILWKNVSLSGVNTGTPDNKSKDYYLNQHSKVASCIIELGNMYSSKDNKLVTTDIDNTAKLIADGIMKYLEQAGYTNGSN